MIRAFNCLDLAEEAIELFQLFFKIFELGVVFVEQLEGFVRAAFPEPVEFFKTTEEFVDLVLGALNGTGK